MHDIETDIALITEAKQNFSQDATTAQQLSIDGYDLFTSMEDATTRGIAVYIATSLYKFVTKISIPVEFKDFVWLKIKLKGNKTLFLGCVYRSPSSIINNDKKVDQIYS
jgi:hypothetical protein